MKKRILTWLLPMLLLCLLPVAAWAASDSLPAEQNGVITLNEDVTLAEKHKVSDKQIIDLNGYTLTVNKGMEVDKDGALIIKDDSKEQKGKVVSSTTTISLKSGSEMTLQSGTIESLKETAIKLEYRDGITFIMEGGHIVATSNAIQAMRGNVTINAGIVETSSTSTSVYGIENKYGEARIVVGQKGGDNKGVSIDSIQCKDSAHCLSVYGGYIGRLGGFAHVDDILGGQYGENINAVLPAGKVCKPSDDGRFEVVALTSESDAQAKIEETLYASVGVACRNMKDNDTLVLLNDVVGNKNGALIEIRDAKNAIVDLNGHSIINNNTGKGCKGIEIRNPENSDGTSTIINSSSTPSVIKAFIPARFYSQDSHDKNKVVFDGDIALETTGTQSIELGGGAILAYSESAARIVGNGGYKGTNADGEAYIYSSFGEALKTDADKTVELLNDYVGNSGIVISGDEGILDLAGHTYTYTGATNGAVWASDDGTTVDVTIKNGTVISENTDGVALHGDNKNIVLDNVSLIVNGSESYGIVTNGSHTNDNVALQNNSVLEVPNGIAMYFPSKNGKVLIDNSNITAHTGVQVCGGNSVLEVNNSTITANGTPIEKSGTENDGPVLDGAAVSVLSRYQGDGENTKVSLNGGTYESKETEAVKAYRFQKVSDHWVTNDQTNLTNKIDSIAISDGNFIGGGVDKAPFDIDEAAVKDGHSVTQVTGGHFSATLDDKYLDDRLTIEVQTPTKNPQAPVSYHPNIDEALEEAKNDTSSTVQPINPSAETVVVTFNINGGEGAPASVIIEKNKTITLPLPTREGYTFLGWQDKAGVIYKAGDSKSITDNVTFTAVWEANSTGGGTVVKRYDVTLADTDNGTITATHKRASKNSTVTITATPDEGYVVDAVTVTEKDGDKVEVTKKDDNKYTFKMPASDVTVKATFKVAPTEPEQPSGLPFTDVAKDAWYFPAVEYVFNNGLMNGTTATTFAPNVELNRAMMAAVLYNMEGGPACDKNGLFSDVADGKWYTDAVNWAASNNIVSGMPDGTYAPDQALTREQMASILYRYAEYKGIDVSARADLSTFTDGTTVSPWAQDVVQWAVAEKLMSGNGNELQPKGTASRAQVATVLMNYCENVAK